MTDFIRQFDGQFEDGSSFSDSMCTAAPLHREKMGEGVSVGEGANVYSIPLY